VAIHGSLYGRWLIDDAGITFAYARSIAEGAGPVLQPGVDPVEGYSNPLWLALLSIGSVVGLFDRGTVFGVPDYVLFPKGLALVCCVGLLLAIHLAVRTWSRNSWLVTAIVGTVLAGIPSFVIWSFSGLENALYAMLVVVLAALMFRAVLEGRLLTNKVAVLTGLVALLAALTRPDGIIYAAAYPLVGCAFATRGTWRGTVRQVALSSLTFLIPYAGFLTCRYLMFGRLVPNTALAKAQSLPTWENVQRAIEPVESVGWPVVFVAAACTAIVLASPSRARAAMIPLLIPLGLAIVAYCGLEADWMGYYRFATPVWALGAWVGTLAFVQVAGQSGTRGRAALVVALSAGVLVATQIICRDFRTFRAEPTVPLCTVAHRYGLAFNGYADLLHVGRGSMLAPDLGGTALTSRLTLVDLTGLADSRVADFYAANDMAGLRNHIFGNVRPVFIHSHGNWSDITGIAADPRIQLDYTEIHSDPSSHDWVRTDLIANPGQLAALRSYARATIEDIDRTAAQAPRQSCGGVLRPGQKPKTA
jgi:hypothetical protein